MYIWWYAEIICYCWYSFRTFIKYLEVLIVPRSDESPVNTSIEKNPLRTTNWTVSWIIQIKGHLFCPTNWYLKCAWTDSGKGPVFCPFVKFFLMRNLVHGNSIAAKENSRNNFYLLSLPSPWEEAMIRNSHSLGVGKKTKSRYDLRNTRKRGSWQDWSQPIFPFSPHGIPLFYPCTIRVFKGHSKTVNSSR